MSKDKELSRADEMRVTIIAAWIDELGEKLKSDWARQRLRDYIRQKLVQGTLPTMDVIAAARAGNEDADVALRELAIEMLDRGEIPAACAPMPWKPSAAARLRFRKAASSPTTLFAILPLPSWWLWPPIAGTWRQPAAPRRRKIRLRRWSPSP
jgi:hypothetical protein